jgi:PAS domain S-box-containing protein
MKHPRNHLVSASSSNASGRRVRRSNKTEAIGLSKLATRLIDPMEHCYRAVLETSSSPILLLSADFIITGWNRAAEVASGWKANEALGRNYMEFCLQAEVRESFLTKLAQVIEGMDVRGFESPLLTRTGLQTLFSWNISRVLGTHGEMMGLMAIGTAVLSATQAEEELRLAYARIRSEARRAQSAAEEERRRIARELHDEFGQALTGLKFDLAWFGMKLRQSSAPSGCRDLLNKVQAMSGSVDALLESVRATAASLRPAVLDDLGLVPALECLATTFRLRTDSSCTLDVATALSTIALPQETSTALFRIAQELLTNVMRHAGASQVRIRLYEGDGSVTLEVTDNGKGIDRERMITPASFGLRGIQERVSLLGGHFHIVGTSGVGTTACTSVPVAECFVR